MEITLTSRHTTVPERFRRHLEEKLAKVEQIAPRADRLDVVVSHEPNQRQPQSCERVELTLRHRREVVRAEACADDVHGALDLAEEKLLERLRRLRDRRKVHHGRQTPPSVRRGVPVDGADLPPLAAVPEGAASSEVPDAAPPEPDDAAAADVATVVGTLGAGEEDEHGLADAVGASPVRIREKTHLAHPMSVDEALAQMEALGHDFYLFLCRSTGAVSLVYRRRGWSYGVIRLEEAPEEAAPDPADQELVAPERLGA
ncbi:ribosome hibernation-promoting factor, HPF/YfiA family [uncultured Pseudokineococcus sp.]|uniref:ribosome hibernation-promoting factor, HPF/YfiA family n=1 Tax=uncultured Pseudokineococcus sp. TaxID=1642928 RepID=UPI00260A30EE|nr:ribosome-associated translation inhibitor RaiA [uncultured Pseudokineococcus sp.]